jgi:hypothetical protein
MNIPNSKGQSGFWEAYRACAEENRVPPDRSPFYFNWAKSFANFLPGKTLKERTGKDIEAFLADLRKRPGIADWQVRQAEHVRAFGKKSGGYLKEAKVNDIVQGLRRIQPQYS